MHRAFLLGNLLLLWSRSLWGVEPGRQAGVV